MQATLDLQNSKTEMQYHQVSILNQASVPFSHFGKNGTYEKAL